MSESFWQKNRLVTHILFDLCLFKHFSPVSNFGQQSLHTFDVSFTDLHFVHISDLDYKFSVAKFYSK